MIAIVNIDHNPRKSGPHLYELRINQRAKRHSRIAVAIAANRKRYAEIMRSALSGENRVSKCVQM